MYKQSLYVLILKQEMEFPIKNYEREAKSITMENISFLNYFATLQKFHSKQFSINLHPSGIIIDFIFVY